MRKNITTIGVVIGVAIAVLLTGYGIKKSNHTKSIRAIYEQAQDMIEQGQYEEAESLLEEIAGEEFADMDISELILYCEAYGYYESGDIAAAYQKLETLTLENVSEELKDGLEDFQKQITAEYEVYQAEKEAEEEAAYEEKIKNGVPFVGMSESRIADTSLGRPSSTVRHNNEVTGGKVYQANLYDFVKNGVTYFTARCVQGKVIQVWDNRDLLDASDNSSSEKKSSSSGSGGRVISGDSSSGNRADNESEENGSEDDPYHVYDYDDPEEFYYDYYDDFDGYEDAETYWYNAWR